MSTAPVENSERVVESGTLQADIVTLSSREVYRNHWLTLREDQILRSNGKPGIYGVVDKDDSAIILPIDFDAEGGGRVWLVEQYRYTIQQRCLELPQGGWEMGEVDAEELARGELKEEIGLDAREMIYLGTLWIAYGFANQKQHVFLATGLTPTEKEPDPEEHDLVVHSASLEEFERMMLDGTIRDNCTLSAWGLYLLWKNRQTNAVSGS
jgi:8-oxo-dGTP pyrophosphatase MutT (NUDIX family)